MVVTNVLLAVLLIAIIADIWHRHATHAHHERAWLDGLTQRFQEQEDRFVGAVRQLVGPLRKDLSDLYGHQLEVETSHGNLIRGLLPGLNTVMGDMRHYIDGEFRDVRKDLADLMKEASDPTILRLMQAIALAFQVDTLERLTAGDGVTESAPEGSVVGPLAPHPVPNIGRKLEPARFSEETISAGMQELIDGAAARGITLSMADARKQAMLMLNDIEV